MRNKIITLTVIFSIVIFIFILVSRNKISLSFKEIVINEVELLDDQLIIEGDLISSGKSYRDFEYVITDNIVYVTIKGGVVTNKYKYGNFKINIKDENLIKIDHVYLKQRESELKIHP